MELAIGEDYSLGFEYWFGNINVFLMNSIIFPI